MGISALTASFLLCSRICCCSRAACWARSEAALVGVFLGFLAEGGVGAGGRGAGDGRAAGPCGCAGAPRADGRDDRRISNVGFATSHGARLDEFSPTVTVTRHVENQATSGLVTAEWIDSGPRGT